VWKEGTFHISDFVAVERQRHSEPIAVHSERDLGWSTLEIHHRHDDVALREPAAEVAELVVRGELCRAAVSPRVLLLTYDTPRQRTHDSATAER